MGLAAVGGDYTRLRLGVTCAQHIAGGFEPIPGVQGAFSLRSAPTPFGGRAQRPFLLQTNMSFNATPDSCGWC